MTRARNFVTFEFEGQSVLLPSMAEAPAISVFSEDWVGIVRALVPNADEVLSLPVADFQQFLLNWHDASVPAEPVAEGEQK